MRLKAAETAAKSSDPRTAVKASTAGNCIAHIVRACDQDCVDHVVSEAANVFQVE